MKTMEPFVVKHYAADDRPTIKGNGFDGLEIGEDREEAERFVAFVNAAVAAERERCASMIERSVDLAGLGDRPDIQQYTANLLTALATMIRA